jgi:hypothetical protein
MRGKRWCSTCLLGAVFLALASGRADATPIRLDGSWTVLDEILPVPSFFSDGPWEWDSPRPVRLDATDIQVVGDRFEIYDAGSLVFTAPSLPDWSAYGSDPFDSPPYTTNPDVAWASAAFSKGSLLFAPGPHSIVFRAIQKPLTVSGAPFLDSTVAFRATPVPEPGTLTLLGTALLGGLGMRWRRGTRYRRETLRGTATRREPDC